MKNRGRVVISLHAKKTRKLIKDALSIPLDVLFLIL